MNQIVRRYMSLARLNLRENCGDVHCLSYGISKNGKRFQCLQFEHILHDQFHVHLVLVKSSYFSAMLFELKEKSPTVSPNFGSL